MLKLKIGDVYISPDDQPALINIWRRDALGWIPCGYRRSDNNLRRARMIADALAARKENAAKIAV